MKNNVSLFICLLTLGLLLSLPNKSYSQDRTTMHTDAPNPIRQALIQTLEVLSATLVPHLDSPAGLRLSLGVNDLLEYTRIPSNSLGSCVAKIRRWWGLEATKKAFTKLPENVHAAFTLFLRKVLTP